MAGICCALNCIASPLASAKKAPGPLLSPRQGRLAFIKQSIDFGQVPQGSIVTHAFYFTNTGSAPLHLKAIHSPCGCTIVTPPERDTFAPQEGGAITVSLNTDHFIGPVKKAVSVVSDAGSSLQQLLVLAADVVPDYRVEPPIIAYGAGEEGGEILSRAKQVTITGLNAEVPYKILGISYNSSLLEVSYREERINRWQLLVRLRPGEFTGVLKEKITVASNNLHKPRMDIYVSAHQLPPIRSHSSYLDFGPLGKGQQTKRVLTLSSSGEFTVSLERSLFNLNGEEENNRSLALTAQLSALAAKQHKVVFTLNNSSEARGNIHGKLWLRTSNNRQKLIAVDFYGYLTE